MARNVPKVSKRVSYVYLYADPRDGHVFYVGKGKGKRAGAHLRGGGSSDIRKTINKIREAGYQPQVDILAHGLKEEEALHVEAAVIDMLGLHRLANRVGGSKSGVCGRVPLSQLESLCDKGRIKIDDPAILIRINDLYRYGMSPVELYDATRGVWKLKFERARKAKYAFAVFKGVVREVYEIAEWLPAGTTFYSLGDYSTWLEKKYSSGKPTRWEFVGRLAKEKVRRKYVGRNVNSYFPPGNRNPIKYVKEAAP